MQTDEFVRRRLTVVLRLEIGDQFVLRDFQVVEIAHSARSLFLSAKTAQHPLPFMFRRHGPPILFRYLPYKLHMLRPHALAEPGGTLAAPKMLPRSAEHTSELQSLMRISYAV